MTDKHVEVMKARGMNTRIDHLQLDVTATNGGVKLKAYIAICSWNRSAGTTMVVEFAEGKGGNMHVYDEHLAVELATEADYQRMIDTVRICPCVKCGNPAFDPAVHKTNREGQCEKCFLGVLNAEFEASMAKENKKLAKLDAKRKAEGFTHRVEAWIHSNGGDKQASFWMTNPTKEDIEAQLKRLKSLDLTDYQLIEL